MTFARMILLLLVVLLVVLIRYYPRSSSNSLAELKINNQIFKIELAQTESQRQQGLSGRLSLPPDQGMLFVFTQPGLHRFWMKDTHFPLDFVWINANQIVDITPNVPPSQTTNYTQLPVYQPRQPVTSVLEINAGLCAQLNIKIGDSVTLPSQL